jgi:hypothetical protein
MGLAEYARKRDFKKTAEPGAVRSKRDFERFVVQKHAASRLHYDFRFRCLAYSDGDDVRLWSRNEKSFDDAFPEIAEAIRELQALP